jgi:hypothetical protein
MFGDNADLELSLSTACRIRALSGIFFLIITIIFFFKSFYSTNKMGVSFINTYGVGPLIRIFSLKFGI